MLKFAIYKEDGSLMAGAVHSEAAATIIAALGEGYCACPIGSTAVLSYALAALKQESGSREVSLAITKVEEAQHWLAARK